MKKVLSKKWILLPFLLVLLGVFMFTSGFGQNQNQNTNVQVEEPKEVVQESKPDVKTEGFWIAYSTDDGIYQTNPITNETELITRDTKKTFVKKSVREEIASEGLEFDDGKERYFTNSGEISVGHLVESQVPGKMIPEWDATIQIPNLSPDHKYELLTWSKGGDVLYFWELNRDVYHRLLSYRISTGQLVEHFLFDELFIYTGDGEGGDRAGMKYFVTPDQKHVYMFSDGGMISDSFFPNESYPYFWIKLDTENGNLLKSDIPGTILLIKPEKLKPDDFTDWRGSKTSSLNRNVSSSFSFMEMVSCPDSTCYKDVINQFKLNNKLFPWVG